MEELEIIHTQQHNREMTVQENTETGEFEKGHPVGHINKYGKQKQSGGSWKYVGKKGNAKPKTGGDGMPKVGTPVKINQQGAKLISLEPFEGKDLKVEKIVETGLISEPKQVKVTDGEGNSIIVSKKDLEPRTSVRSAGKGSKQNIKDHPNYSKSDYDHLSKKGYSDKEIKAIWDRDKADGKDAVTHERKPDLVTPAGRAVEKIQNMVRDEKKGKIKKALEMDNLGVAQESLGLGEFEKAHPVGCINKYGKQKQQDGSWKYVGLPGGEGAVAQDEEDATDANADPDAEDHTHLLKEIETVARNTHTPEQKMKELIEVGLSDVGKIAQISGQDRSDVAKHFVENGITPKPSNIDAEKFKGLLPKVDVSKRWKSYRVMLNMVAKGTCKSMIAYGTGGVGKTYNMNQVFEGHGLKEFQENMLPGVGDYDYVKITGKSTPTAMFKALYQHNGKIVVFDDCDSVLKDETSINILKGALDTTGDGTITYGSGRQIKDDDGEPIPQRFSFVGRATFISNLTPSEMPQPLRSRALTVDLTMNAKETLTRLKEIVPHMEFQNNRGEVINVSAEDRNAAVNFLDKYKNQIDMGDLNARTLGQIALIKKQISDNPETDLGWGDVAISMLS